MRNFKSAPSIYLVVVDCNLILLYLILCLLVNITYKSLQPEVECYSFQNTYITLQTFVLK